ncbi:MAG: glycoside hydrolase family 25 protein [Lachnospiraceae bacterium]|nr:glycoside hydrolase family 25 protein [Lachnospiraceae bacterium]
MKKLKNRTKLYIFLAVLAITIFLLGVLLGVLIGNAIGKKKIMGYSGEMEKEASGEDISEEIEDMQEEQSVVVSEPSANVTNVYIPKRERIFGHIPVNSYKLENFYPEDGFMAYHDDAGNKISWLGVDFSYHQENVNWDELEASGIDFVILRCGYRGYSEGGLVKDEKFDEYATECNNRGIPLGVYFFTQAISVEEAVREAEFVIETISDYKISYPVAFDTEYVSDDSARTNLEDIGEELRTDMCHAFCKKIKEAGYYPMIYASENWIRRELNYEALQEYDFWAPQYLDKNDFMYDFTIWQYTEKGYVPGVDEQVDLDISMVNYAEFVPAMREAVLSNGSILEYSSVGGDNSGGDTGDNYESGSEDIVITPEVDVQIE